MKTMDAARGKWRGILSKWIDPEYLTGRHKPCPMCGGKDRFRFIDHNGSGSWVCNQCQPKPGDGMDLLQAFTGQTFAQLAKAIDAEIGNIKMDAPKPRRDASKRLERIARGVVTEIRFTPVHRYLVRRGITVIPKNVGYHPSLAYYDDGQRVGEFPAMVSRVLTVAGERVSFHVVYLTPDGQKAKVRSPKKILSSVDDGAGVYLSELGPSVVVGEGVETTLAGMQIFGLPGVSGMTSGGLERLKLPSVVREVKILADADRSFTGQAAAFVLAKRLVAEGRVVTVELPEIGTDYADMLAR